MFELCGLFNNMRAGSLNFKRPDRITRDKYCTALFRRHPECLGINLFIQFYRFKLE